MAASMEIVHRQLGELSVTTQRLTDDMRSLHSSVEVLAQDRREGNTALQTKLLLNERTVAEQHRMNTDRLDAITKEVAAIKETVGEFQAIRKQIRWTLVIVATMATVVWPFIKPILETLAKKLLGFDVGH